MPERLALAAPKGVRGRCAAAVAAGAAAALAEGGRALPARSRSRHRACPEAAGRGVVRSPGFRSSRLGREAGRGWGWKGREKAKGRGHGALGMPTRPINRGGPWGGCWILTRRRTNIFWARLTTSFRGSLSTLSLPVPQSAGAAHPNPRGSPRVIR